MSKSQEYISTRSSWKAGTSCSFEEVLLRGYAPDGGLFLPAEIPRLNQRTLLEWSNLTYSNLVIAVAKLFISPAEISHSHLTELVTDALNSFRISEIIKSQSVSADGKTVIVELFHGPTLAFKDLAMTCTAKLLEHFLSRRADHLNIIVSTSGDTGAAAMAAFRNSLHVDLIVIYPLGRVTKVQELQMTTLAAESSNLHLFGISGTSDDGDQVMESLFNDIQFTIENNLSNVNSVNWSRILIQIAHHFFAFFRVNPSCDGPVEIVCPSGAGGNLTAGMLAQAMGLPIHLIACVNENDFLYGMFSEGIIRRADVVKLTLASAMDIQMPYNIERILFLISDGNCHLIIQIISALKQGITFHLPSDIRLKLSERVSSFRSSDKDITDTIAKCWTDWHYLICPHTATGVHYHHKTSLSSSFAGRCCLATASPVKFPQAFQTAGVPMPDKTCILAELEHLPQKSRRLTERHQWIPVIRQAINDITARRINSELI